jgi:hypothetical protein
MAKIKCQIIVGDSTQEFWVDDGVDEISARWDDVFKVIRNQFMLTYMREMHARKIDTCDYVGLTKCQDPKMPDSRLCTYHGTISSVRFDPKYK